LETTTLADPVRQIVLTEDPPLRPIAVTQRYWFRLAFIAILAFAAYAFLIVDYVGNALTGSRAVILLVLPILIGVIAAGYRQAPRGVSDGESDWIVAIVAGVIGFTGLHLLTQRMPTLAKLWHLDSLGVVLWTACLCAIMFGVRYVVRMWQLWLFAACCVSPLPFLLAAAAFGGSDTVIALLTAAIGALAVFLAGRCAPLGWRVSATLVCLASASLLAGLVSEHLALAATVVLVAGVVPVIVTVVMLVGGGHLKHTASSSWPNLPHRSPLSLLALAAVAAGLLVINPPHPRSEDPSPASADWAQRAGLGTPQSFPFITRFVGPDATLLRYTVPAKAGMPTAAVDVITTTRPSALGDFDEVVWYPSSRPLEFQPATSESMPAGARVIHSNADATTDAGAVDWYAVTWVWKVGSTYQRVTVIVNQKLDSDAPPPAPEALSLIDTSITPALWLARQQPDSTGKVDPLVIERADNVVGRLLESSGDEGRKDAGV
jgi:hypothetical protein